MERPDECADAPAEPRLDAPRELSICVWRPEL